MKKLILLLMLPLLALTFNSCSSSDDDDPDYETLIVGKWQMAEIIKVEGDVDEVDNYNLSTITFNTDKTFSSIWTEAGENFPSNGTYKIANNILTLTVYDEYEDEYFNDVITIISATQNEAIFKATSTVTNVGPDTYPPTITEETYSATFTVRIVRAN